MIIKGDGYTFNTETRKLEFVERECHSCHGVGKVKNYPACPHYGKTVTKFEGRKCPHCGSKNKHSHGRMHDENGNQVVVMVNCHWCKDGIETPNMYTSLDFTPIAHTFKLELFDGKKTFNDSYLGVGNFCGATGYTYGKYSTVEGVMEDMLGAGRAFKHSQAGNLVCEDGTVPDTIWVKVSNNGSSYTAMLIGTKFGRK